MNKNIKTYLWIAFTAVITTLSSCKKYLDYQSPSRLNVEQVYESAEYTNSAILGIYNKAAGPNVYGANLSVYFPHGADDFWYRGAANYDPSGQTAISTYGENVVNNSIYNTFTQLYEGIERANIACKYIPNSNAYKTGAADVRLKLKRYYGEALALRSLFYFELLRNWGDVPASFIPAADSKNQFFSHSDRDSTYNRILDDLQLATTLVGWRNEVPEYKSYRLTKGAIKGLRARIALFAGGYALKNETRTMQRRNDYLSCYKIAFDECNDIIQSKQHLLNPVYENVFKSLHSGTMRFDEGNELMFEIAMWGAINDSDLARVLGLQFTNTADPWGQGGGGAKAVPTYFYEFPEGGVDARRDVTLGFYQIQDGAQKNQVSLINLTCAKFRKSWTQFDKNSPSLQFGVNFPVIRYADVLLMYAEAANELQDASGVMTPVAALQEVQRRAYGTNALPVTSTDKAGFFNALVKERLLEFGGEAIRKYDLIRWNLLNTKIQEVRARFQLLALNAPATPENPYNNVSQFIYFKPTVFKNGKYTEELATLDLYGGAFDKVYYTANTVNPGNAYKSVWWRREVGIWNNGILTSDLLNNPNSGYMTKFEPNKKELLPYPDRVIVENRGVIRQNFGWQ